MGNNGAKQDYMADRGVEDHILRSMPEYFRKFILYDACDDYALEPVQQLRRDGEDWHDLYRHMRQFSRDQHRDDYGGVRPEDTPLQSRVDTKTRAW